MHKLYIIYSYTHVCMGFFPLFFRTKFSQLTRKKDGRGKRECQEKLSAGWCFSSILTVQEEEENPDEYLWKCPLNLR